MTDASARPPRAEPDPDLRLPDELETARSKLVYLALSIADEATVDELRRTLGLSKLTLLPVLRNLRDRGLVDRTDRGYAVAASNRATEPDRVRVRAETATVAGGEVPKAPDS